MNTTSKLWIAAAATIIMTVSCGGSSQISKSTLVDDILTEDYAVSMNDLCEFVKTGLQSDAEVGTADITDSWYGIQYLNLRLVDDVAFEYLKAAYAGIDYYGEYKKWSVEEYEFYLDEYKKLINNEVTFMVDLESGEEAFLNDYGFFAGYMESNETAYMNIKNEDFYYFDMNGDGAPELCISSYYIFQYVPELGKCILWGGHVLNPYCLITGSGKLMWNHGLASQISRMFYQLCENGEVEFYVYFFMRNEYNPLTEESEIVYMVALPRQVINNGHKTVSKEIEEQAYSYFSDSEDGGIDFLFRVTNDQYEHSCNQ